MRAAARPRRSEATRGRITCAVLDMLQEALPRMSAARVAVMKTQIIASVLSVR